MNILKNYAELLVTMGANLQAGQLLVILSDIRDAEFARLVSNVGYENGASEVIIMWSDGYERKQKFLKGADFIFDETPNWVEARYDYFYKRKACYVNIISDDPELLKSASPERISRSITAMNTVAAVHRKRLMSAESRWTIGALPSPEWAKKVFPDLHADEAMSKLWTAIAKCSRIDNADPKDAWLKHSESFIEKLKFLNSHKIKLMHFKNSLGTDLTIEFSESAIWMGGGELDKEGLYFFPNIPTEEIFTLPKKTGVNGIVMSSIPLIYEGNEITDIKLEFKDGAIIKYDASQNNELLERLINTDKGSRYLGEVALVPHSSPISEMNMLFYNTLFDENASCHLALGKAYTSCLEDSENMTDKQLEAAGVNDSLLHIDFMIGTKDMEIIAVDKSGNDIKIFEEGNYVLTSKR